MVLLCLEMAPKSKQKGLEVQSRKRRKNTRSRSDTHESSSSFQPVPTSTTQPPIPTPQSTTAAPPQHTPSPADPPPLPSQKKRGPYKSRSTVWTTLVRFVDENGDKKAKCMYCQTILGACSRKNGTSSLQAHVASCAKIRAEKGGQSTLIFQPSGQSDGSSIAPCWVFNQAAIRMALAEMIIIDELPFMFVDHEGFIRFIRVCCPRFDIPCRVTIREDCFRLFIAGRVKLKEFFKNTCAGRVSITTDGWTSVQNFNYICITAHYVGKDWKLHKKIINFRRIQSHKGVDVGDAVANCLEEWGLKSLFTVTVDNASANDTAVTYLKDKLYTWGTNMMGGKYLHMRCVAHIVNLIVVAGLEEMGLSVRQTDLEAKRYKDVVLGPPSAEDWKSVRNLTKYLKFFYELTLVASGTKYVTSHLFLKELSRLVYHIYRMERNDDEDIRNMAIKMKDKVFKYWSEHEETNVRLNHLMYLAPIFDPRYQWSIITYTLPKLYGLERGEELCIEIREELIAMFNVYKENHERTLSQSTTSLSSQGKTTNVEVREEFERISLEELHSPTPQPSSTCVGDQASASSILRPIVQNIVNNTGEGGNIGGLETIVSGDEYSDESTPCMSGASDSG
ncbi:Putative AC transposase [Linum perenne]